jgi:formylmethanofuran dehydrogenase subunit A
MSLVKDLKKEFSLYDIAIMTRTAAARLLGLTDRGHLLPGAIADIAVYHEQADKQAMFASAALVFKNGELVVKDGEVLAKPAGQTQVITPAFDIRIERDIKAYFDRYYSLALGNFKVDAVAFDQEDHQRFFDHACNMA